MVQWHEVLLCLVVENSLSFIADRMEQLLMFDEYLIWRNLCYRQHLVLCVIYCSSGLLVTVFIVVIGKIYCRSLREKIVINKNYRN